MEAILDINTVLRRWAGTSWIAVPAIGKLVATDLSSPSLPGWQATWRALSLPELRAFADAAAVRQIDVTAAAGEWTSTCVIRRVTAAGEVVDQVAHGGCLRRNGGYWSASSGIQRILSVLPGSGWAYAPPDGTWIDSRTGFPIATTDHLDGEPGALNATGYSYFWAPEPVPGTTVVIRECERLKGRVMDISAAMDPESSHPDIRLRAWRPLNVELVPDHALAETSWQPQR